MDGNYLPNYFFTHKPERRGEKETPNLKRIRFSLLFSLYLLPLIYVPISSRYTYLTAVSSFSIEIVLPFIHYSFCKKKTKRKRKRMLNKKATVYLKASFLIPSFYKYIHKYINTLSVNMLNIYFINICKSI